MSGPAESGALVGQVVAQYRITAFLGRGGMGEVYEAFDTRLRRNVALKLLASEAKDVPKSRRRLLREARAASAVSHPGIVGIFEIGEHAGRSFIAMEAVRGRVLAERIADDGPMSEFEVLGLAIQIAEAMQAAHGSGVVHRDLKPRNLMLTDEGRVKILDFGIARPDPMAEIETFDTQIRQSSLDANPGTLMYMSPEQLLGESVDQRSDVFSLGVVVFEMLTGLRPFDRSEASGSGLAAYLHELLYRQPEHLLELRPGASAQLERLVGKMLAKSPEDRYQTMAEVSADLRSLLERLEWQDRTPPEDAAPRLPSRFRWVPRRAAAAVFGVAALSIMALLALWAGRWTPAYPSAEGASTNRPGSTLAGGANDTPCLLDGASGGERTPHSLWTTGNGFLVRFDREGSIDRAIECFEAALTLGREYAPAHSSLSRAYRRLYRKKHEETWRLKSQASAREAVRLAPHLTHAQVSAALAQILSGDLDGAEAELTRLARLDPDEPDIPMGRAEIADRRGEVKARVEWLERAVELEPGRWDLWSRLGDAQYDTGRFDAAAAAYQKSLEITPDNYMVFRNLAAVRHHQGDFQGTVDALQRSLAIRPTASGYSNLGTAYFFQGYYREAAEAYEDALELSPNHHVRWANLGDAYRQIPGRTHDAQESHARAAELVQERLASNPEDPELLSRLALYLARSGEPAAARAALPSESAAPDFYASPSSWFRACLVFESLGERDLALEALGWALEQGLSPAEAKADPELAGLREDLRYHRLVQR